MSEQTTTALTAEQVADFRDAVEAHDDDLLLDWIERPGAHFRRPLPKCPTCDALPTQVRMEMQEQEDGLIFLTFDACGHAFRADRDVMAAGLRIHNTRRQA